MRPVLPTKISPWVLTTVECEHLAQHIKGTRGERHAVPELQHPVHDPLGPSGCLKIDFPPLGKAYLARSSNGKNEELERERDGPRRSGGMDPRNHAGQPVMGSRTRGRHANHPVACFISGIVSSIFVRHGPTPNQINTLTDFAGHRGLVGAYRAEHIDHVLALDLRNGHAPETGNDVTLKRVHPFVRCLGGGRCRAMESDGVRSLGEGWYR